MLLSENSNYDIYNLFRSKYYEKMYQCAVTDCEILQIRTVKEQVYNPSKSPARIILQLFDAFNKLEY